MHSFILVGLFSTMPKSQEWWWHCALLVLTATLEGKQVKAVSA